MLAPPKPSHDDAELLIKEARERQQRRRLLGAAGVAIAAGLTLGIHAVVNVDREHPRVHSSRGPRAVAAPCSAAAGWGLRLDGTWSEPTEQETAPLEVTRVGTPCTLRGYPHVVLLGAGGHRLDFRYSHGGDIVVAKHSPRAVHIAQGGSAFFLLNKNTCVVRNRNLAHWLRVTLPGVRGRLILRLPHYPMLGFCPTRLPRGAIDPGMTIAVSPIVANLSQATAKLP